MDVPDPWLDSFPQMDISDLEPQLLYWLNRNREPAWTAARMRELPYRQAVAVLNMMEVMQNAYVAIDNILGEAQVTDVPAPPWIAKINAQDLGDHLQILLEERRDWDLTAARLRALPFNEAAAVVSMLDAMYETNVAIQNIVGNNGGRIAL